MKQTKLLYLLAVKLPLCAMDVTVPANAAQIQKVAQAQGSSMNSSGNEQKIVRQKEKPLVYALAADPGTYFSLIKDPSTIIQIYLNREVIEIVEKAPYPEMALDLLKRIHIYDYALIAELLQKKFPNCPSYYDEKYFTMALGRENPIHLKVLLAAGADPDPEECMRPPLYDAIEQNNYEIAQVLLQAGADPNRKTDYERSPLSLATRRGKIEFVTLLLQAGANPNIPKYGETPLYHAIMNNEFEIAQILLRAGADPNQHIFCGTPLSLAAADGKIKFVTLLLQAGADPNLFDSFGLTPLHRAVRFGGRDTIKNAERVSCINALIQDGACIDTPNKDDLDTPLHRAVFWNNVECVKALKKAGANVNAVNAKGRKPLYILNENNFDITNFGERIEIIEILTEADHKKTKENPSCCNVM